MYILIQYKILKLFFIINNLSPTWIDEDDHEDNGKSREWNNVYDNVYNKEKGTWGGYIGQVCICFTFT